MGPITQSEVSQEKKHQFSVSSVQFSSVAQSKGGGRELPTPYVWVVCGDDLPGGWHGSMGVTALWRN